ncbi:hypothetical protein [Maliponia aquimaris]|uniref:Uncharacterized protein n=1 Tax=Maliponia aquimaris TaxID=1673631 RepID=A0A238L5M1_9RHOB|nr:hypothetical protein [Maliponia aquimaris]SMX50385.1 hypothetical protein MAA8898_04755 [Maliponia aquimaris]
MEPALQINSVFRGAGWQIVKPLEPLAPSALAEDLAQYAKGPMVVAFGYFDDGTGDRDSGEFRICAVRGQAWQTPVAALSLRDANMALDLLRQMPGLLGRLGHL